MTLSQPITINIYDFFVQGKFDCVEIGQTKEWLLNNFPNPDDYSEANLELASIWRFGNIEFHFADDKLAMIFCDYLDTMTGGQSLELEKWILADCSQLTLLNTQKLLNQYRIDYQKITTQWEVSLLLASNVRLSFSIENDKTDVNTLMMTSWHLS